MKATFIECDPDTAAIVAQTLPEHVVAEIVYVGDGLEVPPKAKDSVVEAIEKYSTAAKRKAKPAAAEKE